MLSYRSRREMNTDEPTPCSTATVEPQWKSRIPRLQSLGGPQLDKYLHIHLHHGTFQFVIKNRAPQNIKGQVRFCHSWPEEYLSFLAWRILCCLYCPCPWGCWLPTWATQWETISTWARVVRKKQTGLEVQQRGQHLEKIPSRHLL